jgi:hypothetical protein
MDAPQSDRTPTFTARDRLKSPFSPRMSEDEHFLAELDHPADPYPEAWLWLDDVVGHVDADFEMAVTEYWKNQRPKPNFIKRILSFTAKSMNLHWPKSQLIAIQKNTNSWRFGYEYK